MDKKGFADTSEEEDSEGDADGEEGEAEQSEIHSEELVAALDGEIPKDATPERKKAIAKALMQY